MSRNKKKKGYCYFCGAEATTSEHFPPKSFFPEDSASRANLKTVPSCDEHNAKRSDDDEYTLLAFTMISENCNEQFPKVIRALKLNNQSLYKKFFYNSQNINGFHIKDSLYIASKSTLLELDRKRIDNVIDSICRAIYYQDTNHQKRWEGKFYIYSSSLNPLLTLNDHYLRQQAYILTNPIYEIASPKKGSNHKIFFYQIFKDENDKFIAMRMVFYESVTFFVFPELIQF